MKYKFST